MLCRLHNLVFISAVCSTFEAVENLSLSLVEKLFSRLVIVRTKLPNVTLISIFIFHLWKLEKHILGGGGSWAPEFLNGALQFPVKQTVGALLQSPGF